jgi:hypothetical protein
MPSGFRDEVSAAGSVALALRPNHPMWTARRRRREVQTLCAPSFCPVEKRKAFHRMEKKFNCCMLF